jgi:hypothetical protein
MLRKFMLTAAAAGLVVAPVTAQAVPARVAAPVAEAEYLSQGLMLVLFAAGFAVLVLALADNGDLPASP